MMGRTQGAHARRVTWKSMTWDVLPLHLETAEDSQDSIDAAGGVDDLHGLPSASVPRLTTMPRGLPACRLTRDGL